MHFRDAAELAGCPPLCAGAAPRLRYLQVADSVTHGQRRQNTTLTQVNKTTIVESVGKGVWPAARKAKDKQNRKRITVSMRVEDR